ncbi:VWA domain-containing protein [Fervidibacter sacchari]|uniref:Ca-activated chloride channel family protein n=1 Tax=Candidatus Fervidibacter sacchari TaxID=1448929 RepID=A0ABT2EIM1_9BACT|nr:VIT domain-containing protein [Candidatus Fervidibacter sacchari]MCS3917772.1 Ca-activated chloride channel family protein [Candidatus Fervidibacter sacchari]WKU15595.1 VWA domain-containing protein [Candidatus Fervidibacter sacchari]
MRWVLTAMLSLLAAAPVWACGIVLPPPDDRPPIPRPTPVPGFSIRFRHMEATIVDGVVQVNARQAFVNEAPYQREGIYLFPAPENAAVNRLALVIDGKTYEAELLSRDEAVRTYERIVGARRDPALLEFVNRQTFRLRIFPFPPQGQREVIVRYDQLLRRQGNTYRFVYPLRVERLSDKPVREASITVRIRSRLPIKTVYSPTHPISVRRPNEREAIVTYEASNVREQDDFVLYYSVAEGEFGATLLPYRNRPDRDGYFLLFLSPQLEWEQSKVLPKDIVFVFDRTGSMSGEKIEQAKEALKFCIERLNSDDRFNVIAFNESPDLLWRDLRLATEGNKREAIRFAEQLTAQGGTNINEALLTALPLLADRERPRFVMFLTDGLPTVGETNVDRILANVRKANEAKARIFVFGVGYDVNAVFLDRLANENGGASIYVRPNESVEAKIADLFSLLSEPVLTDVQVTFGGVRVRDVYPKQVPDLFKGTEVVLAGAYAEGGKATVRVTGKVGGKERTFTFNLEFPDRETEHDFVPRIWAARKIGYLLDELATRGRSPELIDEIVRLSKEFGVLTEFTAFLVTEPTVPLADLRTRVDMELRRAAEARTGTWAVAQAINRQVLQRATANYDLAMGNQAPVRQQAGMAMHGLGGVLGGYGGFSVPGAAGPPAQVIVGRSGEVQAITGMQVVGNRTFAQRGRQWVDLRFDPQKQQVIKVRQFSKAVMQLIEVRPDLAKFIALGEDVIIAVDDKLAVQIGAEGKTELSDDDLKLLKASAPTSVSNRESHGGGQSNSLFAAILVAVGTTLFAFAKRLLLC